MYVRLFYSNYCIVSVSIPASDRSPDAFGNAVLPDTHPSADAVGILFPAKHSGGVNFLPGKQFEIIKKDTP